MPREAVGPWPSPAHGPGHTHPGSLPEGETEAMSNAQRSTLKWEKEETLGELATVAPVLYTNVNFPNLKEEYPGLYWMRALHNVFFFYFILKRNFIGEGNIVAILFSLLPEQLCLTTKLLIIQIGHTHHLFKILTFHSLFSTPSCIIQNYSSSRFQIFFSIFQNK